MEEGWERPPRLALQREQLNQLIAPAFPGKHVASAEVLATGLANTNLCFQLQGEQDKYVLRLYTRDPAAAARELELMRYLAASPKAAVPVAPLIYSAPEPTPGHPPYSIWGFVEGELLQALWQPLSQPSRVRELVDIAETCGRVLALLSGHRFATCGEFGPGLSIVHEYGPPSRFVPGMAHRALFEGRAGARLGDKLTHELWRVVERASPALRAIDNAYTLVHADYKRSNLLVQRRAGAWQVAAVLDWEFACAGPPLIDVGLFLRAGTALPSGFREAFAAGYREGGGHLPSDWWPLSRLVDVVSQLTFLDDPHHRPRVFAETTRVLEETIRMLV